MPSRAEIKAYIASQQGRVGKREIARAFRLGPEHRVALRGILRSLAHEGEVAPAGARRFRAPGRLPEAAVVQITGTDRDGDPIGRPVEWEGEGPVPMVLMAPEPRGRAALAPGQRVLAKLRPIGGNKYEGRTLKRLGESAPRVLGLLRASEDVRHEGALRLVPTDRRAKAEWLVPEGETMGAEPGEICLAEPLPQSLHRAPYGLKPVRIVERLGRMGDARSVSLICLYTHDIPQVFPPEALEQARKARGVALGRRTDLRDLPLVTIDGEDARDFDDAVFAEPVEGGGLRLVVAIADVAWYVRPGTPLDVEARKRGNSCYFPDRVVPMLPEALSNGWCSLKPREERGCLFVEMQIDPQGRKIAHRFGRGLMRSFARLTYTEVQQARDEGSTPEGVPPGLIDALYEAFGALLGARRDRGTLDLDLPERKVVLDEAGKVAEIKPRPRLDSHRLIEEFMVLANVAAAEELERLRQPAQYRVHAPPGDEKLENLRGFLSTLGLSLKPGGELRPADLDAVLQQVVGTEAAAQVNEAVLRAQSQAEYSPDNIGHFGLALPKYAHFTSPIRRYADLMVHRALITGLKLGLGGLGDGEAAEFEATAEHITATERRAALAERDAIDRYLAAYMADKIGARFAARISGVTRFGLFVTVIENGASGLVPIATLPDDYWVHDETAQALIGRRTHRRFTLAQPVEVVLVEATPITGGMVFALAGEGPSRHGTGRQDGRTSSRKPGRRR
ncbi:ribonuclease R [Endobacter medicaginis]|uniref:Ribonuclease R n=2 Tax=Endobacter medicaginis TaxID=1181271 RepID=A0A839UWV3_9PROT|nr:ribonuclease R [Endobacter medicaginis]MBB3174266.1 ribonuclease R [Endobacter medicaginis]MCX5476816.1 ribonuclease R [Endobacter medicaginis]